MIAFTSFIPMSHPTKRSFLLAFYICLFTFYPKAGIVQSKWVIGFGIVGTLAGIIYSKKILQRIPVIRWSGLIMAISLIGLSFSQSMWLQTLSAIVLGFFIFFPITALVSIPHELPNMNGARITVIFSLFYLQCNLLGFKRIFFREEKILGRKRKFDQSKNL